MNILCEMSDKICLSKYLIYIKKKKISCKKSTGSAKTLQDQRFYQILQTLLLLLFLFLFFIKNTNVPHQAEYFRAFKIIPAKRQPPNISNFSLSHDICSAKNLLQRKTYSTNISPFTRMVSA